jgi:hypothetical protein
MNSKLKAVTALGRWLDAEFAAARYADHRVQPGTELPS